MQALLSGRNDRRSLCPDVRARLTLKRVHLVVAAGSWQPSGAQGGTLRAGRRRGWKAEHWATSKCFGEAAARRGRNVRKGALTIAPSSRCFRTLAQELIERGDWIGDDQARLLRAALRALPSAFAYVRPGTDIHSNTIEGVFSLIKRGVMGTFHSVSAKHIPNYLNEFEFRWNTRKLDDGERVSRAIKQVDGKRLEYRESVDNPPYLVTVQKLRIMGRDYPEQGDAPLEGK